MKYKYLLLDADGTVLDFARAEREALDHTLKNNKIMPSPALTAVYSAVNDKLWHELEQGKITREQLKTERFVRFIARCGLDADAGRLSQDYIQELSHRGYYLDGAQRFLSDIRAAGLCVAIVTNGIEKVQRGRAAACGLMRYAQALIISECCGCSKPDVRIANRALNALGCEDVRQAIMVGDSAAADIEMGVRAGCDTCFFSPQGNSCPRATYSAATYGEIEKILGILPENTTNTTETGE